MSWQDASARPDRDCRIRRAEATTCPSFRVFGPQAKPTGVSGDGAVLVGSIGDPADFGLPTGPVPARWIRGTPRALGPLPPPFVTGLADAASRDGSVITGRLFSGFDGVFQTTSFRWQDGAYELIDFGFPLPAQITAMSGDGDVFGATIDATGWIWEEGDIEEWEDPRGISIVPSGISDAGDIVVGTVFDTSFLPFERVDGVTHEIPAPGDGTFAQGISPDGSVVVGFREDFAGNLLAGLVWRDGVLEELPFAVGDASFEGLFLLGRNHFWDAAGTPREIEALLAELGVDVPVVELAAAEMSNDGHVVVGPARLRAGEGFNGAFMATFSPKLGLDVEPRSRRNRIHLRWRRPIRVRVFGSAQADVTTIEPDELAFGPARAQPIDAMPSADRNRDGYPDRDFLFDVSESGLARGDRQACLAGAVEDLPFRLCSRVRIRD